MAIEHASTHRVYKPWGCTDLRPWSDIHDEGHTIGEIWFQRPGTGAPPTDLLIKFLFTNEPLSIQVHPSDAVARSLGLERGKTEAWYILSAAEGAQIALGLKRHLSSVELRNAIEDGSIADLVRWCPVLKDDIVLIPAGTIHALGAGIVVAEVQQRSDTTFRLFDHGREREVHIDSAIASANAGPAPEQPAPRRMTDARTLLATDPHFILERIDLTADSNWALRPDRETWLVVLGGRAKIGLLNISIGEAAFMDTDCTFLKAGENGMKGLLAYTANAPRVDLLHHLDGEKSFRPMGRSRELRT